MLKKITKKIQKTKKYYPTPTHKLKVFLSWLLQHPQDGRGVEWYSNAVTTRQTELYEQNHVGR